MVRTRGAVKPSPDKQSNQNTTTTEGTANDVDQFLNQLAKVLQNNTNRAWKAKQVTVALEKSIDTLPDGELKAALKANIKQHASDLHRLLAPPQRDEEQQPSKRTKRTPSEAKVPSPTATVSHPTFFDDSLLALIDQVIENGGTLDATIDTLAPLFARNPPTLSYINWLVNKTTSSKSYPSDLAAKLDAANVAFQLGNAVAGQAASDREALAAFLPTITHLQAALDVLLANLNSSEFSIDLNQLESLAGKVAFCMTTVRQEVTLASNRAAQGTRWLLDWDDVKKHTTEAQSAAEKACCGLVSIRCAIKWAALHTSTDKKTNVEKQVEQFAAAGFESLAPYSITGFLSTATTTDTEALGSSPGSDVCFFAQYEATARKPPSGIDHYMVSIYAARKVSSLASSIDRHTQAATILDHAGTTATPNGMVAWLKAQPPSAIVLSALTAMEERGPVGLSQYLVHEATESAVKALWHAAAAGQVVAGGDEGMEGETDDLLFFVSKKGDETAFGGQWEEGSDEDEQHQNGEQLGLRMEELPDIGRENMYQHDESESEDAMAE